MAEIVKLAVEPRQKLGTRESRRLRKRGYVPGNIYGHGGEPETIAVPEDVISPMVFAGHRIVELDQNGKSELAMLREVQWDLYGTSVIHFDLIRVDRNERVSLEVPVETRGISPGVLAGGHLELRLHSLTVECPAFAIPEHIVVRIGSLNIGDAVHVRDLDLGDGVDIQNDPDEVVLQVVQPIEVPEEEEAAAEGPAQPEVIGKKEEESED